MTIVQVFGAVAAVVLACLAGVADATSLVEARALAWKTGSEPALLRAFPDVASVGALVEAVLPKSADGELGPRVDAFSFADLRGDGSLELICTLSDGGRFFPTVLVISKGPSGFTTSQAYDGGALDVPRLADVIIDAGGTKRRELLLPRWLGGVYPGAWPGPVVYDIFSYEDGRLIRNNLAYAGYYQNVIIPRLDADIDILRSRPGSGEADIERRRAADIAARETAVRAMRDMLRTRRIP